MDKWEEFKNWFMHIYNKEMSKISESDRIKSIEEISKEIINMLKEKGIK